MRYVLTGGGTGGHVYPALAIAGALATISDDPDLLYVGSSGGMESSIVAEAGLTFREVPAGSVRGRSPIGVAVSAIRLIRGTVSALRLLTSPRAGAVLATGGYVCVPVVLAAWLRRIPVVLYLPDVEPGLAVRFLSRFATRIAVTTERSRTHFSSAVAARVVATGYPVRPEIARVSRSDGRLALGLPAEAFVLLVFGGSRGALTLNEAAFAAVGDFLTDHADLHLVHVCGRDDEARAILQRGALPAEQAARYHPYGYLHSRRMASALASADLIVSRSGASVMGEFPCVGAPSILVPYPHAGAHQTLNAGYLVDAGAAVIVDNGSVKQGSLPKIIGDLVRDRERLAAMSVAARSLARPGAALAIAHLVVECADGDRSDRGAAIDRGDQNG